MAYHDPAQPCKQPFFGPFICPEALATAALDGMLRVLGFRAVYCPPLRTPLKRWYRAAVKFLVSPREFADQLQFGAFMAQLAASAPPGRRPLVCTMIGQIYDVWTDLINEHCPADCPHQYDCALAMFADSFSQLPVSAEKPPP